MKNGSNKEQDIQPMMILTIDIGNGHVDKLQLFDLNNIEQETYDFCVKNKLDFNTMQEINNQIQNVLKDKQLEEEQEIGNVFQEIKEEEDEKITENNINEIREQESIIITNSNELDTQKGNKNDIIKEKKNNTNIINKNEINKIENEKMNSINSNGNDNCNGLNAKKNNNQSIRTNSTISNGIETKKIKKINKPKKKNIKENIKEAIAMAKEKTKQNKQQNKENNNKNKIYNNFYKKITNKKKENNGPEENIIGKEEYNNNNNNINNMNKINDMNIESNEDNNEENKKENIEINEGEAGVEDETIEEKQINNDVNHNQIQSDNLNIQDKKEEEASPIIENKIIKNNSNCNSTTKEIENNDELNKNKNNNEGININNNINNNIIMKEGNNNISKENQNNKKKNRSNNESNISGYNPGKELYERGIKFKESEKEKLEALKKNLEVDEEEDNTFTPKINKLSDIQMEKIREKRLECTNPDIINNYKEYKEAKMEILKKKTDEEFNRIYTFKPYINRSYSTTKIQNNRMNEKDNENNTYKMGTRFDKLYNYRIDYQENKDKLKEKICNKYSFKPRINENSSFYKLKIPFNERLQTYSNKSRENMAKIQQIYERELGYDEPFKPQLNHKKNKSLLKDRDELFINEAQKYNTNNNNNVSSNNNNYIDPYTKLYLYGKKYEQDKNFMAEKYYQDQIKPPQFCQSTEDIINKKKEKSFKQIFKLLDGDEDSKISSTHINTSKLPKNILRILEPVLNELKEENETLNEIEFIFVCDQLYLSLPWNERRELTTFEDVAKKNLKKEKIMKEKNNFSFKPRINKRNYSFENQTILTNNKNTDLNSNINHNEIFNNKYQSSIINSYKNYNNYYIKRKINENSNEKNKENKIKNGKNQINNRVNYFNLRITNKNNSENIIKNNNNENNHLTINSKSNANKDKYSILKNVDINIIGNNSNSNKTEKKSKVVEKKINYENFVNV